MTKNPSIKAAEKAIKKAGFRVTQYMGSSFKIVDDGGHCYTVVDIKRSAIDDKIMLVVDKLSDMANNFRDVCTKLDGMIIKY